MPLAFETMGKTKKLDNYFQTTADSATLHWHADAASQSDSIACVFTLPTKSHSDPNLLSANPNDNKPYNLKLTPNLEQLANEGSQAEKVEFRRSFESLHLSGSSRNQSEIQLRKVASCAATTGQKVRRRVTFADESGRDLVRVRIIKEPSHVPPKLHLRSRGSDAAAEESGEESPDSNCRFKCQFAQPSSKYIMFREALEKNCVSLSNVYFDNCTIKGSIVVKNISFRKRVFVRVTFNDWCSFVDHDAVFASSQDKQMDSFVFSFTCPSGHEGSIMFCICYQCEAGEFWDSNSGSNYKILPQRRKPKEPFTRDCKPNFTCVTDFTEFSPWQHFSDSVYY